MIKAEVVADSLSPQGHRLVSVLCTFPRIILAEVNTHRMLSKNTSSSRAIPFKKMVQAIKDNPFIPIAWQKDHPGMQGTEYLDPDFRCSLHEFIIILNNTLNNYNKDSKEYIQFAAKIQERIDIIETILVDYEHQSKSIIEWWLFARDKAIECASILYVLNVTKQLCNRILEPFMWTTMLITGNLEGGWDNFFNLRCPNYEIEDIVTSQLKHYKSKKETIGEEDINFISQIEWLKMNKGQAEIHMMQLAESIYDAFNESTPKQLKAGEWHIPFRDKIILLVKDHYSKTEFQYEGDVEDMDEDTIKISTAMGARTSYTIVGEEKAVNYSDLIALDDRLLVQRPPHSSPMEHCARCMNKYEAYQFGKRVPNTNPDVGEGIIHTGWCRNFRGFIQRRHLIETLPEYGVYRNN